MKLNKLILLPMFLISAPTFAQTIKEVVYVESPTDTDGDGELDRIYVSIERPTTEKKLSTMYTISPYSLGGTEVPMHTVDMDKLPQDDSRKSFRAFAPRPVYADVKAHSLGTGYSTGCPTVGDINETLAAKAVIDWLNGRARAFKADGSLVTADWANGKVGMTGVSYNGTLPIMVATTGVEGLKAIIPVAAISNWYNYYRANGLVVNPGGYIGEDADILGYYIVRRGACKKEMAFITEAQGREDGDFTPFWQARNYLPNVKNIKAATFIIHGQNDWNVKQKHAIDLWEALEGVDAPKRMFLHRGGHSSTSAHGVPQKVQDWFAHFLEDIDNGITEGPQVEVELPDGTLITQNNWPHEDAKKERLYFTDSSLVTTPAETKTAVIKDLGSSVRVENLLSNSDETNEGRLVFLSDALTSNKLLTGTPRVSLKLSVLNRKAANITVAVIDYDRNGKGKVITRGWADPQNHADITKGELLIPGQSYNLTFDLEPKQYQVKAGNRLGIMVTSTDYEYTLRPKSGTEIMFELGSESFIDLDLK